MTDLPSEVQFGKVEGRFRFAVGDGPDVGSLPDAAPAIGTIIFRPVDANQRVLSPELETIASAPPPCLVDADGYLVDSQGARGVWLAVGTYDVTFDFPGARILPTTIVVTTRFTEATPMNLALAIPPKGQVLTMSQYAELSTRLGLLEEGGVPGGGTSEGGVLLDTDGVPYYVLTGTAFEILEDTDGVPYFA